jgi:hypothetical protein
MITKIEVEQAFNLIDAYINQLRIEAETKKRITIERFLSIYQDKLIQRNLNNLKDFEYMDEITWYSYRRKRDVGEKTLHNLLDAVGISQQTFKLRGLKDVEEEILRKDRF